MKKITADFEIKSGYLWTLRPGKTPLKVATEMVPVRVYCDENQQTFALGVEARAAGEVPFEFRLEARELFNKNTVQLEQAVAWNHLECWRTDYLMRWLQANLPTDDAVVVNDLLSRFEDDAPCKWFRRVWNEQRKRVLAVV